MASDAPDLRVYIPEECIVFRRTQERFGGLSNMAPGFPIRIDDTLIRTSEALYQACRFPHLPEVQQAILDQASPMTAKMKSKPFRGETRPDWEQIKVPLMKWCLKVKLVQNWREFSRLLLASGTKFIVEESRNDSFWGALVRPDHLLEGRNVLGRLLMELRQKICDDPAGIEDVPPLRVSHFDLLGKPIPWLRRTDGAVRSAPEQRASA